MTPGGCTTHQTRYQVSQGWAPDPALCLANFSSLGQEGERRKEPQRAFLHSFKGLQQEGKQATTKTPSASGSLLGSISSVQTSSFSLRKIAHARSIAKGAVLASASLSHVPLFFFLPVLFLLFSRSSHSLPKGKPICKHPLITNRHKRSQSCLRASRALSGRVGTVAPPRAGPAPPSEHDCGQVQVCAGQGQGQGQGPGPAHSRRSSAPSAQSDPRKQPPLRAGSPAL